MRSHDYRNEKVSVLAAVYSGIPLSAERYRLSVVYSGGDGDIDLVLLSDASHSAAGLAGLVYDPARSAAFLAGASRLGHAEGCPCRCDDRSGALAVRADLRSSTRRAAAALAVGALHYPSDGDILLAAEGSLFEAYINAHAYIVAFSRSVRIAPAPRRRASEAEKISEYVAETSEVTETSEITETKAALTEAL